MKPLYDYLKTHAGDCSGIQDNPTFINMCRNNVHVCDASVYIYEAYIERGCPCKERAIFDFLNYYPRIRDHIYTYCQLNPGSDKYVIRMIIKLNISFLGNALNRVSYKLFARFCDAAVSGNTLTYTAFLRAVRNSDDVPDVENVNAIHKFIRVMSLAYMRRCTPAQILLCCELLYDTNTRAHQSIGSYRQLLRLHDEQMAERARKLRESLQVTLEYTPELKALVESCGYYLPKDYEDFVARGNRDHNCVANYARRQLKYSTLIVFSDEATYELHLLCNTDTIVSVKCIQAKKAYNKNVEHPVALINALTGCPKSILGDTYVA
jgi:hypothetical protein